MGRKRQYATDAERQRAFRRRQTEETVRADRAALERLGKLLDRLQQATWEAAQAGDPLARAAYAAGQQTLLERLAAAFEARAAPVEGQAPPRDAR